MNVGRPHTAVCPTLDSEVLNVLVGTTRPLTGREIARLAGRLSHSGVLDVLHRLAEHGLVERQEAGRALLFTLNREHLAASAVELLANMRHELFSRLRRAIENWEVAPSHVSLFGSAARGEGDTQSDIDLFVVRPSNLGTEDSRWRSQVDDLAISVFHWTGNRAGIAEVAEDEVERLLHEDLPIVGELSSDAIVLAGPEIGALTGTRR